MLLVDGLLRVVMFTEPGNFAWLRLRPWRVLDELAALHRMAPEAVVEVLDAYDEVVWMWNPGLRRVRVYYSEDVAAGMQP